MLSISNSVPRSGNSFFDDRSSRCRHEEAMVQNEKRCREMLECKRQIDFWRTKLERLEEEHTVQLKLAHLRLRLTSSFWRSLSSEDRTRKEFILAAMEFKGTLPEELYNFPNSNLLRRIRADRDILLARVARDDFEQLYDYERLWVPPELRGDKQVILAILPKHCNVVESISEELRDDNDVFLTMLRCRRLPNLALQHFSERIRSDKKLVRKLCAHIDGMQCLQFASSDLRNDKEFMLEVIHTSHSRKAHYEYHMKNESKGKDKRLGRSFEYYYTLRYVSQRLQDDEDIVLAAVAKSGTNLKYASYRLRRNLAVVTAAIENERDGDAFRYCLPGETKDKILADRNVVLNKIIKNGSSALTSQVCLDRYENDHEMILEALRGGVDRSSLPLHLQNSRAFVKESLLVNSESYLQLPLNMRQDFEFARAAIQDQWVDERVILEAIEQCPRLLSDRNSMLRIVNIEWVTATQEILRSTPDFIRADKEIMLQAVKNDMCSFDCCAEGLKTDRDFMLEAFTSGLPLVRVPDFFSTRKSRCNHRWNPKLPEGGRGHL